MKEWLLQTLLRIQHSVTFNGLIATACLMFDVYYGLRKLSVCAFFLALSVLNQSLRSLVGRKPLCLLAQLKAISWVLANFSLIWHNRIKHWSFAKISKEKLLKKFVRIRLKRSSLYLLPHRRRLKFCSEKANEYESALIRARRANETQETWETKRK